MAYYIDHKTKRTSKNQGWGRLSDYLRPVNLKKLSPVICDFGIELRNIFEDTRYGIDSVLDYMTNPNFIEDEAETELDSGLYLASFELYKSGGKAVFHSKDGEPRPKIGKYSISDPGALIIVCDMIGEPRVVPYFYDDGLNSLEDRIRDIDLFKIKERVYVP